MREQIWVKPDKTMNMSGGEEVNLLTS